MINNPVVLNGASTALAYGEIEMIDYFSLALGHGLLAIALLRLVMRDQLDVDPHVKSFIDKLRAEREAGSVAGRNASRRQRSAPATDEPEGEADG